MNDNRYRLIYNHARRCLMAVAETVTSQGKSSGETQAQATPPSRTPDASNNAGGHVSFTGIAWAIVLLCNPSAFAQIIADPTAPGHQQPTVHLTGKDVPHIHIQTPNAAGLSHNKYQQFDIPQQGAILNNSRQAVQTQRGVWVDRNPNLMRSGPANTILNEVRSTHPSVLKGFLEVAGQSAHVIVSNPTGITCDGCGFINAHRSTLTTGVPQLDGSGNLAAYRVTTGMINIFGNGLNDTTTHYTDILARAVAINAKIHAQQVRIMTGANTIPVTAAARADGTSTTSGDTHLGEPHPLAADPANRPAFALDVAELGGLYANKAWLIGTEAGLGVRTSQRSALAIGEFRVTTAGEIVHRGTIKVEDNVAIHAAQGITTESGASLTAKKHLHLTTQGNIHHAGTFAAQHNVDLNANGPHSTITSAQGSVIAAGVSDSGQSLANGAQLNISATEKAALNGTLTASGDVTVKSHWVDLRHSQTTAQNISLLGLNGQADSIDTRGATITATNFTANAANQLTTDGATLTAHDLFLNASHFSNISGSLTRTNTSDWLLHFTGNFNNTGGTIKTNAQQWRIKVANLHSVGGSFSHQGSSNLAMDANQFDMTDGKISTANTLTVNADQVSFNRATVEASQFNLSSRLFANHGGTIKLTGNQTNLFNITGLFDNTAGQLLANGNLQFNLGHLNGVSLLNQGGTISAVGNSGLSIQAMGEVNNSTKDTLIGGSFSGNSMTLSAKNLNNASGTINSVTTLNARTTDDIDNTAGTLTANGLLKLTAGALNNTRGTIQSLKMPSIFPSRDYSIANRVTSKPSTPSSSKHRASPTRVAKSSAKH